MTYFVPNNNEEANVGSDYWRDLQLWRPLMERLVTIAGRIFVPETSPILLYSRGLVISDMSRAELDPFEVLDLENLSITHNIVLWSSNLVTRELDNSYRGITRQHFKIYNSTTQEYDILSSTMDYRKILFILTSQTGSIRQDQLQFVKGEFKKRKISFFLPDVIVQIDKSFNDDHKLTIDCDLESQFDAIMTGDMDVKLPVRMY